MDSSKLVIGLALLAAAGGGGYVLYKKMNKAETVRGLLQPRDHNTQFAAKYWARQDELGRAKVG